MPVDNQCKQNVSSEFLDTMDAVETFIQQCNGKQIIVGGDMNLDVRRQNAHDKYFSDWCDRLECFYVHSLPRCEIDFTYHDPSKDCFTCIDHFTVSETLLNDVLRASVCKDACNPSNHQPIVLELELVPRRIVVEEGVHVQKDRIAWHKVNERDTAEYHRKQEQLLSIMRKYDVIKCRNVKCQNVNHKSEIDSWCHDLVECCLKADVNMPRVKNKTKCRSGWNNEVKPYREDCIFWHKLWLDAGQPSNGVLYDVKKYTKKQYMYANCRNKRRQDICRKEKMANAISKDNSRDFFKEVT